MASITQPGLWVEQWLSHERFATFLVAANGSRQLALELYEWNTKLGSAFLHDLAHLEVGLRNAYNEALAPATLHHENHWTESDSMQKLFPVIMKWDPRSGRMRDSNYFPQKKIQNAILEAGRTSNGNPLPGKIVAEVMFGFWAHLTSSAHDKTIWVPYLNKVYPPKTNRKKLHDTLQELREIRNRVAHHEPLIKDPELDRRKIVSIGARLLPPEAIRFVAMNSEISKLLAKRPK